MVRGGRPGTLVALAAVATVLASACSAGSRGALPIASGSSGAAVSHATATLTFTIPLPLAQPAARERVPAYVSPASALLDVTATNGITPIVTPNIALAGVCTTSATARTCSVPVPAPIGNDTFVLTLEDAMNHPLSTRATTVAVAIAEGAANVVPPIVLDPIAATATATYPGTVTTTTAATPLTLGFSDAANQPVGGLGTFATNASDTTAALTFTTQNVSSGTFSTHADCSSAAVSFTPWTPASSVYFCPNGANTLGSIYTVGLGAATTTFAARRTGFATSQVTQTAPGPANPMGATATWLAGGDTLANFAFAGEAGGNDYVYAANFTSLSWAACNGAGGAAIVANNGTTVLAVPHGTATLAQFTLSGNVCAATGASVPTGSDVVAIVNDPQISRTATYSVSSDFATVAALHAVDASTLIETTTGVNCGANTSLNRTYPTSLGVGPGGTLYVGCFNGLGISDYATQPAFSSGASFVSVASAPYQGVWVAANADVAYAVATGAGHPLQIYTLVHDTATLAYTVPNATLQLSTAVDQANQHVGSPLAVGNDDRLYLVVNDGMTHTIVSYDPFTQAFTDPAIAFSSVITNSALSNVLISAGPSGTILVGGNNGSGQFEALTWPH